MHNKSDTDRFKTRSTKSILIIFLHNLIIFWLLTILLTIQNIKTSYAFNGKGTAHESNMNDRVLQKKIEGLHRHIWKYFFHPEVNLIYDYIPPLSEKDRWKHLPTKEEINEGKPNLTGWTTGMEDCALNGGAYLAGMVYRYDVTKKPEHAEEARKIFQGLRLLGTVSHSKGFVARAVLPDGKTFYPNSSVDQYTMYVFGLWTYYHSSIATEEEKKQIDSIIDNTCKRIEKDNFEILSSDNKPAQYCDIGNISADRSSRVLEIFLIGFDITRQKHWLDIYTDKLKENEYARLQEIMNPAKVNKLTTYSLLQNQVSLIPLFELEGLLPVKNCYLEALRINAKIAEDDRLLVYKDYRADIHTDDYTLGLWRKGEKPLPEILIDEYRLVRIPSEALLIILLSRNKYLFEPSTGDRDELFTDYLRDICHELLSTYDFKKMRGFGMIYAEIAYWLAVKQNLLVYTRE